MTLFYLQNKWTEWRMEIKDAQGNLKNELGLRGSCINDENKYRFYR